MGAGNLVSSGDSRRYGVLGRAALARWCWLRPLRPGGRWPFLAPIGSANGDLYRISELAVLTKNLGVQDLGLLPRADFDFGHSPDLAVAKRHVESDLIAVFG